MKKPSIVVIFGAGSSVAFGVPTLRYLFKDEAARRYLSKDHELSEWLEKTIWTPRGYSLETSEQSLSIEDMLTFVRDSTYEPYRLKPILAQDYNHFRKGLYCLIKRAVYDNKSTRGGHLNSLIEVCRSTFHTRTWTTFNWDCMFESSFYYSSGTSAYDRFNPKVIIPLVGWKQGFSSDILLKLHGGINWWYYNGKVHYLSFARGGELTSKWKQYQNGARVGRPLILEPSSYKYSDPLYKRLSPQWKRWMSSLVSADVVLVIGYSIPDSDTEAKTAIMLGFQNNLKAQWIVVDPSQAICSRYKSLLGHARLRIINKAQNEINDQWNAILQRALRLSGSC
jgi:hypothetical protein